MSKTTRRQGWLQLRRLFTSKGRGDRITAQVGDGAQGVAVGKNIFQNVTVVITALPAVAILIVAVLLILVGAVVFRAVHHTAPPLPWMSGDVNIAVAQFGLDSKGHVVRPQAGSEISGLADELYQGLNKELSSLSNLDAHIQLLQPSVAGWIDGPTSAAHLARDVNANIIIYGNVELIHGNVGPSASQSILMPVFYFAPRKLPDAEELGGSYDLRPITTAGDVTLSSYPVKNLISQLPVQALVNFILGMDLYQEAIGTSDGHQAQALFKEATTYLRAAERDELWNNPDGKEVLYLYLGSAAGRLGDYKAADAAYTYATDHINPEYARAWVGRGQAQFQLSRGNCPSGHQTNPAGLREALRDYERAGLARDRPSDIQAWVAFGLGQTYLCLSQGLAANNWSLAADEFTRVIAIYNHGDQDMKDRVQELAAEAHGDLGLLYLLDPHKPQTMATNRSAADDYLAAIELTTIRPDPPASPYTVHPELQAAYYGQLEYLYGRLREYDKAKAAYSKAIQLDRDPRNRAWYKSQLPQALRAQVASLH